MQDRIFGGLNAAPRLEPISKKETLAKILRGCEAIRNGAESLESKLKDTRPLWAQTLMDEE